MPQFILVDPPAGLTGPAPTSSPPAAPAAPPPPAPPAAPPPFRDRFNTQLPSLLEDQYQRWQNAESLRQGRDLSQDLENYDLRGYWVYDRRGDMGPLQKGQHLPDTWKKPNHPTFSNESDYSGVDGFEGGQWRQDDKGKRAFTPGRTNLDLHGDQGLTDYFAKHEPKSSLQIPPKFILVDPPQQPQAKKSEHWSVTRGLVTGLTQQNPEMLAQSLEGLSDATGVEFFREKAGQLRQVAKTPAGYEEKTHSVQDVNDVGTAFTYLGERLGEGLSSTVPSLVGGTAGAVAGGAVAGPAGAVVGGLAGAGTPAYVMNFGDLRGALIEEGVDPKQASKLAAWGSIPVTALDMVPVQGWVSRLTGRARADVTRSLAKRIAREAAKGAGFEGVTEAAQQLIQEAIGAGATGKDLWTPQRMWGVFEAWVAGTLTGGAVGGGTGVIPDQARPPAPQPTQPPPSAVPAAHPAGPGAATPLSPGGTATPPAPPAGPAAAPPAVDYTQVADAIIGHESGGDPNATNSRSTSVGAGQFIESTWLRLFKQARPDLAKGRSDADILALRRDPALSREMTAAYAEENAGVLATAGLPVTPGTLRLGHHFGGGDAAKVLKADPQTPLASLLSPQVMAANPYLKGKSAGWLVAHADSQMKGAGLPSAVRPGATPAASSTPGTAAAPSEAAVADDEADDAAGLPAVPLDEPAAAAPPEPIPQQPLAAPQQPPAPSAPPPADAPAVPEPSVLPDDGAWWHDLTPEGRRQAVVAAGFVNKAGLAPTPKGLRIAKTDWRHLAADARETLLRNRPADLAPPPPTSAETPLAAPAQPPAPQPEAQAPQEVAPPPTSATGSAPTGGLPPAPTEPATMAVPAPPKSSPQGGPTGFSPDRKLRADYGVEHIDGYHNDGATKKAFLDDARGYLKSVAKALTAQGFVPHTDRKGRPGKAVTINESGDATGGDASLQMYHPKSGHGIYLHVTPEGLGEGITVMGRYASPLDRYGARSTNRWLGRDMTAGELAVWSLKESGHTAPAGENPVNPPLKPDQGAPAPTPTSSEKVEAGPPQPPPVLPDGYSIEPWKRGKDSGINLTAPGGEMLATAKDTPATRLAFIRRAQDHAGVTAQGAPAPLRPKTVEQVQSHIRDAGGRITPNELGRKTALDIEDAERVLDRMAAEGHAVKNDDGSYSAPGEVTAPTPPPAPTPGSGGQNYIFTQDAYERAKARLRKKLDGTQLNSGIDPEILTDGAVIAGYHIERGTRAFAAWAGQMVEDLGENVRPYLKSLYNFARDYPGLDTTGMTPADEVAATDVASIGAPAEPAAAPDAARPETDLLGAPLPSTTDADLREQGREILEETRARMREELLNAGRPLDEETLAQDIRDDIARRRSRFEVDTPQEMAFGEALAQLDEEQRAGRRAEQDRAEKYRQQRGKVPAAAPEPEQPANVPASPPPAAGSGTDEKRPSVTLPSDAEVLAKAGLTVTTGQTKYGKPLWRVAGNTRPHKDLIKRIGGKWYQPKQVWTFFDADPRPALAEALRGSQASETPAPAQPTPTGPDTRQRPPQPPAEAAGERFEIGDYVRPKPGSNIAERVGGRVQYITGHGEERRLKTENSGNLTFFESDFERAEAAADDETALPEGKFNRLVALAKRIARAIGFREVLSSKSLQRIADEHMGGTLAEGKYDRKDLYDAIELGVNLHIARASTEIDPRTAAFGAKEYARTLSEIIDQLPTQTVRSEEQVRFQQFSTPPDYAFAVAWAANIGADDTVLEPSAGTGNIAVMALKAKPAEVIVNELSPRRTELVKTIPGIGRTFTENAEQLNNILPDDVRPTVVVMNPPFSQTAGRMGDKKVLETGAIHIEQALKRLEPGGRLVAIVGRGMGFSAARFAPWWQKIRGEYSVRANIAVAGGVYKKYGTTFDTRVLIIDKVAPQPNTTAVTTEVSDVPALIDALAEVRNVRQSAADRPSQPAPAQPGGAAVPQGGEAEQPGDRRPAPAGAGAVGPGGRGASGQPGRAPEPPAGAAGGTDVGVGPAERPQVAGQQSGRPGRSAGADGEPAQPAGGRSGGSGVEPAGVDGRPDAGGRGVGVPAGGERVAVEEAGPAAPAEGEITDVIYEPYQPQRLVIKGAQPHPGPLVQSAAMASVQPPKPTYALSLPKSLIESGALSAAQLEAVVYAGQAHSKMLPAGAGETPRRRGFFIGDGTGVGKGREVAGVILDNWKGGGAKKAVWISEKKPLINDAKRDWKGLDQDPNLIFDIGKSKQGSDIKAGQGILFSTYDTLKQGMSDQEKLAQGQFIKGQNVSVRLADGTTYPAVITGKSIKRDGNTVYPVRGATDDQSGHVPIAWLRARGGAPTATSRLDQIVKWLGKDFDGVIAFDESHNMANAVQARGKRGVKEAAAKALAGVELQRRLPNARVLYVSATGATEVANLAYAERLGLWGRGTPFATMQDFVNKVSQGGIAAMELVARDLKALGSYMARGLSYDGVEYDRLDHTLTPAQRENYDTLAEAWQVVLQNINAALQLTAADSDGKVNGKAKSAAYSAFWGAHQRFFNQIITAMQMPSVQAAVERDVATGRQVVLQLVNTNEASQERAAAKIETAEDIEDLDITPRDQLIQLIERSFPTAQHQEVMDDRGNVTMQMVLDSNGKPVENREAVRMREQLIDRVSSVKVPQGPLEILLDQFGADQVAEVTGRGRRFILKRDPDTGEMRRMEDSRGAQANVAEAEAFQGGKKKILVFSEAGGTGRSYHADNNSASKGARRVHYLLQAGWRADKAIQGFGRTHRTNQASAPVFRLVSTDLKGQKRFISSIARRLAQLGALTKGQRQTGDQGVFSTRDNLESQEARDALEAFYGDLYRGEIDGLDIGAFQAQTGLNLLTPDGTLRKDLPEIQTFLNRLLSLSITMQDRVFAAFEERMDTIIEAHTQAGTLDAGLETLRADKVTKDSEQTVYTDEESGAETKYVKLTTGYRVKPRSFASVVGNQSRPVLFWVKSARKFYAVVEAPNVTGASGQVMERYRLIDPTDSQVIEQYKIDGPQAAKNWTKVTGRNEAKQLWEDEIAKLPEFAERDLHLITGAVLPIWDRLGGHPRVIRLQTDAGERLLGRVIPHDALAGTLRALGAEAARPNLTPEQVVDRILQQRETAVLSNGWTLANRTVAGEERIEVRGVSSYGEGEQLVADGAFAERINYERRYFIPTGATGPAVLQRVTQYRPIVEMQPAPRASSDTRYSRFGDPTLSTADRQKLKDRLRAILRQLAPKANLAFVDDLVDGQGVGKYEPLRNLVTVSLGYGDATVTLRHEALHALKEAGLFAPGEWAVLERGVRGSKYMAEAKRLYPDTSTTAQAEEAVAQLFGEFRAGAAMLPRYRRVFAKVRDFLTRLANALRGMGFHSVESIFGKVEGGEVGQRTPWPNQLSPDANLAMPGDAQAKYSMFSQPAQDLGSEEQQRLRARIRGTTHVPARARLRQWIDGYRDRRWAGFKQAVLDRFHVVRDLGETRGNLVPWMALQLTKNLPSVMRVMLRHGPLEVYSDPAIGKWFRRKDGWTGGGFEDPLKSLASRGLLEQWKDWAWATREQRFFREDQGKPAQQQRAKLLLRIADEEQMTPQQVLDTFLGPASQHPEFQQIFDQWQAFNREVLNMARDAGLLTQQMVDLFTQHGDYVPFYRLIEEMDGKPGVKGPHGSGPGVEGQRSPARRLKGGLSEINDPVENMVMNMTAFTDRAFKNLAMQKVTKLALDTGAMETTAWKWWGATEVTPEQAAQALEAIGVQVTGMTPAQHAEVLKFFHMQRPTDPDIVSVMFDGKPKYYRVTDPLLLQAVTAHTPVQLTGVLKLFGYAKHGLTAGVTKMPAFMLRNSIRDTVANFILYGVNPLNSVRGALASAREDPDVLDMMAAGGGGRGFYSTDPADVNKAIEAHVGRGGRGKVFNPMSPKDWLEAWERVGQTSEQMNRVARYRQVLAQGGTQFEASFEANDLLDFGMHGSGGATQILIQIMPFLNARIQGLYKLGRAANANRRGVLLRSMLIASLTLALLMDNWDDEEYERKEDWEKDAYWWVRIGGELRGIPKPFELGLIAGVLPERVFRSLQGRDDTQKSWDAFKRALTDTLAVTYPQAIAPLIAQTANKDLYTGRPIETMGMESLPAQMRYRPSTSETARAVSSGLGAVGADFSPVRIEALVRGYLGGLGQMFLQVADIGTRAAGNFPERPEPRPSNWPVLGSIARMWWPDGVPRNTQYTTDFYALRQEVEQTMRGIKELRAQGLIDEAKEMADNHRVERAMLHTVRATAEALTTLGRQERMIGYSTTMTPEQKRDALDRIAIRRNELTRRAMLRVPAVTRMLSGLSANENERQNLIQWAQPENTS